MSTIEGLFENPCFILLGYESATVLVLTTFAMTTRSQISNGSRHVQLVEVK